MCVSTRKTCSYCQAQQDARKPSHEFTNGLSFFPHNNVCFDKLKSAGGFFACYRAYIREG